MINDGLEFKTSKDKNSDEYLIEQTDLAITELVFPKYHLLKAYNYYHGVRDPELFRYLEENFGISNPTSLSFTPLVKKHIDALVGEYLDIPILPRVSCKDKSTLSNIQRDKQLRIYNDVYEYLKKHLNNGIIHILTGQQSPDVAVQKEIEEIVDGLEKNFISEYEVAALNVINYIIQSNSTDFKNKMKILLIDLLITGMAYYRVIPSMSNENIEIEVLNPLQVFTDYNPESVYRKDDYRSVVVKFMSLSLILAKYGHLLEKDLLEKLKGELSIYIKDNSTYFVRTDGCSTSPTGYPSMPGLISQMDVTPGWPRHNGTAKYYTSNRLIPVYEVEWIVSNRIGRDEYSMDRYEAVRIASDVYVLTGKSENVIRSKDNPKYCGLNVNGIYFQDRNSEPYSLMLSTMNLQDQYDLLIFFRDNLIANSGTAGDWLDVSQLPSFLGTDVTERVLKWLAYKKGGIALIDTSQEGRAYNANTVYAGYDDSIKAQAIQAVEIAIERTENTCSSITGVFRERLNGILQEDAVTNIAVGVKNSFIVTKLYYQQMDILLLGILLDSLNLAKIVYKRGITGTLILGDKSQLIFTALPEHFTITDYDIHIPASSDVLKQLEEIKLWAAELIKGGNVSPEILVEVITSRSLTEMKFNVNKAIRKQKEEVNLLQELSKLNLQLLELLQEATKKIQHLEYRLEYVHEEKIKVDQEKNQMENERKWFEAKKKAEFDSSMLELKNKLILAEVLLLYDGNHRNDEIKNIV